MKAIKVKFLPVTDSRGSRVKASAEGAVSRTLSYDHGLDADKNANEAARALIADAGWFGLWARGKLRDCWVFVCLVTEYEDMLMPFPETVDPSVLLVVRKRAKS